MPDLVKPVRVVGLLRSRTWLALAPVAVLAFGLAFWGFGQVDPALTAFERIERSAHLLKGGGTYSFPKDPWQLAVAQWLLPLVALLTAAKLFLANARRDLRIAFAKRSHDHVIVCGLGRTGKRVVEILRARGERVLAIDLDAESAAARAIESLGAPTIPGDAKSGAVLHLAGVRRARMLVACTGDDTANLEIALSAVTAVGVGSRSDDRLVVVPELRADWLFEQFASRAASGLGSETADLRLLSVAESAGRLLCRAPAFITTAILRPTRVDLVIFGFGDVGRAVAAQALRTAFALPGRRMRLMVFDARGEAATVAFAALHPGIAAVADLDACEVKVAASKPECWESIRERLAEAHLAAVVVCLPDDGEALYAASRARADLDARDERAVPVFVRVAGRRKLAEVMAEAEATSWLGDRLVPFGDLGDVLAAGLDSTGGDVLARACHEVYLETLAAPSNAPSARQWHALPELFKRSNRLFADHLEVKLRAAGLRSRLAEDPRLFPLTEEDLEALSAAEHERWVTERRLAGWRYDAIRNDAARRHPLIRPWSELPDDVRSGTRATVSRIPAILARVGREICRDTVIGLADADAALASINADEFEHFVLMVDLADPTARTVARRMLTMPNLTLRLAPTEGSGETTISADEIAEMRARIDGSLDPTPSTEPKSLGSALEVAAVP